MKKYILALDQGTTSSRAIVFDKRGSIIAVAQKEFRQIFPKPGWVEHDANEIWSSQIAMARKALKTAGITAQNIAAIGITNQRETTVVWNRDTGKPICNAIVWQDRRTASVCDQLRKRRKAPVFQRKTGLVLDAYFSGTKVQWILKHVKGAKALAKKGKLAFGTIDSWLVWNLTNGQRHVTDVSNASRTLLYNIKSGKWDKQLLDILEYLRPCCRKYVPPVRSMAKLICWADPFPSPALPAINRRHCSGRPVSAGAAKNTYGTGCFMLMNTGTKPVPSKNNLLTTVAWKIGDRTEYALEGSVFTAGAAVQWLRDGLGIIKRAPDIEKLATSVADNGGVYVVPAFAGLGAPHWDQYARGTIVGLTRGSTKAHIARATLEGIAFQVTDVLQSMHADAGIKLKELRVDGGACANNFLMQFQSDLLGVPVIRPKVQETTALGAAYLAGLAVGYWKDQATIARQWQQDRKFTPKIKPAAKKELIRNWAKALERSRSWED